MDSSFKFLDRGRGSIQTGDFCPYGAEPRDQNGVLKLGLKIAPQMMCGKKEGEKVKALAGIGLICREAAKKHS